MNDIVSVFFSMEYEKKINKDILFCKYNASPVKTYVDELNNIPLIRYVSFIEKLSNKEKITPRDVFQFSDFNNATDGLCKKIIGKDKHGLKFIDVGKMLLDDGEVRKDGAYTKYGENHIKTAEMLGLAFELCKAYYLSGLGYVYIQLDDISKEKLIHRLILRNKLIVRLYQAAMNGKVNVRDFFMVLSDSTYIRRRGNVKKILTVLSESKEYDFTN